MAGLSTCRAWRFITAILSFTIWAASFQQLPPPVILHDEPISWEDAWPAYMQNLPRERICDRFNSGPIAMNKVGEGQPDMHDASNTQ